MALHTEQQKALVAAAFREKLLPQETLHPMGRG
jgi:hypothetical protein